ASALGARRDRRQQVGRRRTEVLRPVGSLRPAPRAAELGQDGLMRGLIQDYRPLGLAHDLAVVRAVPRVARGLEYAPNLAAGPLRPAPAGLDASPVPLLGDLGQWHTGEQSLGRRLD